MSSQFSIVASSVIELAKSIVLAAQTSFWNMSDYDLLSFLGLISPTIIAGLYLIISGYGHHMGAIETGSAGLYLDRKVSKSLVMQGSPESKMALTRGSSSTPTNTMQRDLDGFKADIFYQSPDHQLHMERQAQKAKEKQLSKGGISTVKTEIPPKEVAQVSERYRSGFETQAYTDVPKVAAAGADAAGLDRGHTRRIQSPTTVTPSLSLKGHVAQNRVIQPHHGYLSPSANSQISDLTTSPGQFNQLPENEAATAMNIPPLQNQFFPGQTDSFPSIEAPQMENHTVINDIQPSNTSVSDKVTQAVRDKLSLKQFVNNFYRTIGGHGIRIQLLRHGKLVHRFLKLDRDNECLFWNTGESWLNKVRGKRRSWPVTHLKSVSRGMRICAESPLGKAFTMEVEPSELIHNIKLKIATEVVINMNEIELYHNGKALSYDKQLVYYGIENGATLVYGKRGNKGPITLLQNVDRLIRNQLAGTGPFGFELVLQNPHNNKLKTYMLYVEKESERDFFVKNFQYMIDNLEVTASIMRSLNPKLSQSNLNQMDSPGCVPGSAFTGIRPQDTSDADSVSTCASSNYSAGVNSAQKPLAGSRSSNSSTFGSVYSWMRGKR